MTRSTTLAAAPAVPEAAVAVDLTGTEPAPTRVPRPRADAVRNRERILVAAREVLVELGSGAPFDEVARRAGIGNATLYRHFPDRAALVHHVVLFVMDRVTAQAEDSLAEEPDAFAALCRFTHAAADERIGALCPMLAGDFDSEHPELVAAREALAEAVETLVTMRPGGRADPYGHRRRRPDGRALPAQPAPAGHQLLRGGRVRPPSSPAVPGRVAGPGPLPAARFGGHPRGPEAENHVTPAGCAR